MEMETDNILLQSVFPREVWQIALKNVQSLASYQKIRSSSPFFDSLSAPSHIKAKALFPSVLPFLVDYLKDISVKTEDGELYIYSVHKQVIKLRKICHDWRNAVDTLVQSFCEANIFEEEVEEATIHFREPYEWFLGFNNDEEFLFFRERFEGLRLAFQQNPIISRAIFIKFDQKVTEQQRFLQTYGHHVWFCALNLGDISDCSRKKYMSEQYPWVCSVLKYLPNIKRLCIVALDNENQRTLSSFEDDDSDSEDEEDTEEHWKSMPKLEKLQSLNVQNLEDPVDNDLIRSNSQITLLQTNSRDPEKLLECHLPNLRELTMLFPGSKILTERNLKLIKKSPVNWKLTKLCTSAVQDNVSWKLLFDTISQKFGTTLKELEITLPHPNCIKNYGQLALPQLEKLHVIMEAYVTIDFILPMKSSLCEFSLSVLDTKIFLDKCHDVERETKKAIRFYECRNEMWQSNIWELFPKLKKTRFEITEEDRWISCHRSKWQDFAKGMAR